MANKGNEMQQMNSAVVGNAILLLKKYLGDAEECINKIRAAQNWTQEDGNIGGSLGDQYKDQISLISNEAAVVLSKFQSTEKLAEGMNDVFIDNAAMASKSLNQIKEELEASVIKAKQVGRK